LPDRPPSLQDYLADQLGEMDLDETERRLARHICSFVDRTGYLGARDGERRRRQGHLPQFTLQESPRCTNELVDVQDVEDTLVHVVQKLEPPGSRCPRPQGVLAPPVPVDAPLAEPMRVLIRDHLEDVAYNRIPVIQKATRFDIPTIQDAIAAIHHPRPQAGAEVQRLRHSVRHA